GLRDLGDADPGRGRRGDRARELPDPTVRGVPGRGAAVQERVARHPARSRAADAAVRRGRDWTLLDLRPRRPRRGGGLPVGCAPRAARGHGRIRKLVRSFRWPPPPDGKSKRWPAPRGRDEPGRPLLSLTPTDLRVMPHGATLEYLVTGEGQPTTAFAHGIAGGIADTRPLGSGVSGRKVFFQFRGHGRSDAPADGFSYADLAADLRAVSDEFGATRALGVSLGAGALCRLLAQTPDRFERVVFYLPAVLDEERPLAAAGRTRALLDAIDND